MTHHHVMLDLETLGTSAGCVILSIGACVFNPYETTITEIGQFFRTIKLEDSIKLGFRVDASTLDWWLSHPKETYKSNRTGATELKPVLDAFSFWFPDNACVWGQGASFDQPILTAAYEKFDALSPWDFRNVRDTRTLFALCEEKGIGYPEREKFAVGQYHNALDDAITQAKQVQWCYHKLLKN